MNFGGDPGQDDYGLPPVDVEVPDDARELDRDVLAYHRELRMLRRQRLLRRLHEPITRDGMVLPLLAGALALTLLAGTMLTVFTSVPGTIPTAQRTASSAPRRLPSPGQLGGPLPNVPVVVAGQQQPARSLRPAVLALVPANCGCQLALRYLKGPVGSAGFQLLVVSLGAEPATQLARDIGLLPRYGVQDTSHGFAQAFHPRSLTAVFVRFDGVVAAIVPGGRAGAMAPVAISRGLRAMSPSLSQGSIGPRTTVSPSAVRAASATASPARTGS